MSIHHAILGILSRQALSGYDLKKVIQDSPFMPWSGNNNQIYKSLVELLEQQYLTSEVHHQDSSPTKKVYTITERGLAELKRWALSAAEPPEYKKMFLVQLTGAHLLNAGELELLLTGYEEEVHSQLAAYEEIQRRDPGSSELSTAELIIRRLTHENLIDASRTELAWIQRLRRELTEHSHSESI